MRPTPRVTYHSDLVMPLLKAAGAAILAGDEGSGVRLARIHFTGARRGSRVTSIHLIGDPHGITNAPPSVHRRLLRTPVNDGVRGPVRLRYLLVSLVFSVLGDMLGAWNAGLGAQGYVEFRWKPRAEGGPPACSIDGRVAYRRIETTAYPLHWRIRRTPVRPARRKTSPEQSTRTTTP